MGARRIIIYYAAATVIAASIVFRSDVHVPKEIRVDSQVVANYQIREWKRGNSSSSYSLLLNNNAMANSSSVVVTIIVHTSGELGNHMMHLAHAYSIAWLAERNYGIQTKMIIHDQITGGKVNGKSKSVKKIITKCFPNLQPLYDSPRANTLPEYTVRVNQQRGWKLVNETILQRVNDGIASERDVEVTLEHLHFLVHSNQIPEVEANSYITLPFIESISMNNFKLVNWFYHELRQLFSFNDTACCLEVPDRNETVLVRCTMPCMFLYMICISWSFLTLQHY